MVKTHSELHTHLVGMLNGTEFLYFLNKCGIDKIHIPKPAMINYETNNLIINKEDWELDLSSPTNVQVYNLLKSICIDPSDRVDYDELDEYYANRTEILKEVTKLYSEKHGISKNQAEIYVYNLFINESLRSLVRNEVKYVEISYSFANRINFFKIAPDLKDKIKCKFLLSTQRNHPLKSVNPQTHTFEQACKNLKSVLHGGNAVGFDIMGEETPLTDDELNYDNEENSFMRKLELIIKSLLSTIDSTEKTYDMNTLRIHSGETRKSYDNTIKILQMIDEISKQNNMTIPPPEIRIGHGLYFSHEKEYIELLKKFKCIIEINATSNYKLSNIDDFSMIPYEFYIKNDIPIVISTDGHGLYNTTNNIEDDIAARTVHFKYHETINDFDKEIISRKGA